MTYMHILACIDISDEQSYVLERAARLVGSNNARFSVVHVLSPLAYLSPGHLPLDQLRLEQEIEHDAKVKVELLAQRLSVVAPQLHFVSGKTSREIHKLAHKIGADLIVIGTHGRHGIGRMLGSTANAVLHGAECDVLVVRI